MYAALFSTIASVAGNLINSNNKKQPKEELKYKEIDEINSETKKAKQTTTVIYSLIGIILLTVILVIIYKYKKK